MCRPILKINSRVFLIRKEYLIIKKSQFDRNNWQNKCQGIMCWSCKCLGHYSKDCEMSKLKLKAWYIEISKSTSFILFNRVLNWNPMSNFFTSKKRFSIKSRELKTILMKLWFTKDTQNWELLLDSYL